MAVKLSVIVAVIIALYFQDLSLVFNNALVDEASFHILAIPFLFAYLLYRKRKMISATLAESNSTNSFFLKHFSTLIGVILCAAAILAYWYGSYTFTPLEYHMVTLPFLVAGLTLILFNTQVGKQLAFPIAFLIFLTPPPVEILYTSGGFLANISAEAANWLANGLGMSSVISFDYGNPVIMLTRTNQTSMIFSVDVACSGVYSIIGFLIFALFIAYIVRGRLRNKFSILLLGIPLIIALNILRITTIITIGYHYGDDLALQVFHLFGATVLMFIGTLILLAVTEKVFKTPKLRAPCQTCSQPTPQQTEECCPDCGKLFRYPKIKLKGIDLAKIASIAVIIVILLTIQAPVFFGLSAGPAQVLTQTPTGEQGNTELLPQIPGYTLSYVYRDVNFQQLAKQEASLVYSYSNNQTQKTIWVAVEIAATTAPLHRWETCLINWPISHGAQVNVRQLDLRDVQTQKNPPIIARFFAFQYIKTNQTQVVLYWYEKATFTANGTSQQKHIKMSLVMWPNSSDELQATEDQLLAFATAINQYWQPIKNWTTVGMTISKNGLVLSSSTSALLIALVLYNALINRRTKQSMVKFYSKLPEKDQQFINAVNRASEKGSSTVQNIANQMEETTKTKVTTEWVNEKLEEAHNNGLIKRTIVNQNDHPTVTWKQNK